jgi:HEAT repeat protein
MDLSRRSLLAAAVAATCEGWAGAQAPQAGTIVGQMKPQSTEDFPTSRGGKNLKQWIAEIKSTDPSRRENAIRTIPLLKGAQEAIPDLIDRVEHDNDSSPRVNAVMALGAVPVGPREDVSRIVNALKYRLTNDSQSIIRFQCALVLGRFGEQSRAAMKELIQGTKDGGSWEIRKAAVFALTRAATDLAQPVNSSAVEALVARLSTTNEPSALVRLEAAMSIATLGMLSKRDHEIVTKGLTSAEYDREKMVAIWARVGLAVHDNKLTPADIKTLIKNLESPDLPARTHSARALGTIASVGNPANLLQPAIPYLIKLLDDREELAQVAGVWALGRIGPDAKAALPRLKEMLQDKNVTEEGKEFVKEAIGMIEGKVKK